MRSFVLRLSCLAVLASLLGCGGGKSGNPNPDAPLLKTVTALIGPSGGSVDSGLASHERVTFAPNALNQEADVVLTIRDGSGIQTPEGTTLRSHAIEFSIDGSTVANPSGIVLTADRIGEDDLSEPSNYLVTSTEGTQVIDAYTNTTSTPQIQFSADKRQFSVAIRAASLAPRSKGNSRASAKRTWQFLTHTPQEAEADPHIRPFKFRTEVATSAQALGADNREKSDAIEGACWTPLDQAPLTGSVGRIAVLVHGINNRINNMSALAYYVAHLKDNKGNSIYSEVWGIDHDWQGDIGKRGDQLAEFINAKYAQAVSKADLFAHSQGTLVSRYALEISGGDAKQHISRVYLFAPMNNGIPLTLDNFGRLGLSTIGFGFIGIKQMLRSPDEYYKKYWGILDRLVDSSGQGSVPYTVFTGGHPASYNFGALTTQYGDGNHDGIVPWSSSKYIPPSHTNVWTELPGSQPEDRFNLNHKEVVGRFILRPDEQDCQVAFNGGCRMNLNEDRDSNVLNALHDAILASVTGTVK